MGKDCSMQHPSNAACSDAAISTHFSTILIYYICMLGKWVQIAACSIHQMLHAAMLQCCNLYPFS